MIFPLLKIISKSIQKYTLLRNDTIDYQADELKKGPKVLPQFKGLKTKALKKIGRVNKI
jgi:hypothetical protein